jgi:hypothetical protein
VDVWTQPGRKEGELDLAASQASQASPQQKPNGSKGSRAVEPVVQEVGGQEEGQLEVGGSVYASRDDAAAAAHALGLISGHHGGRLDEETDRDKKGGRQGWFGFFFRRGRQPSSKRRLQSELL